MPEDGAHTKSTVQALKYTVKYSANELQFGSLPAALRAKIKFATV